MRQACCLGYIFIFALHPLVDNGYGILLIEVRSGESNVSVLPAFLFVLLVRCLRFPLPLISQAAPVFAPPLLAVHPADFSVRSSAEVNWLDDKLSTIYDFLAVEPPKDCRHF